MSAELGIKFFRPFDRDDKSNVVLMPASFRLDVSLEEIEPKRSLDIDGCSLSAVGALVIIYPGQ
jgi:hypothetical protein